MFVKLTVLACIVAAGSASWNGPLAGGVPAHQYPAGVSPQACPNFPNCANPAVSANPNAAYNGPAQPQWNGGQNQWNGGQNQWNGGQNQWNGGQNQWNAGNQWNGNQNALDRGEYTGDGDYRGEGLREALAPGYGENINWNNPSQWGNNPAPQQQAYNQGVPHGIPAQIPAGVDARSCPNYPFCH